MKSVNTLYENLVNQNLLKLKSLREIVKWQYSFLELLI